MQKENYIVCRGRLKPGQYLYAYMKSAASFDNFKDAQNFIWKDVEGFVDFYRDYGKPEATEMTYNIYQDGHFYMEQVYGMDGKQILQ
tara:strand:- start:1393 stop:1653 length:261 start_codon:yes stop_codon:yes gene_type:complete